MSTHALPLSDPDAPAVTPMPVTRRGGHDGGSRKRFRVVLQPGQTWPDNEGGLNFTSFRWLYIENRSADTVYVDLDQAPDVVNGRYLCAVKGGQELTRNLAGPHDVPARHLHIALPAAAGAAVQLLVEVDDFPIVSQRFAL